MANCAPCCPCTKFPEWDLFNDSAGGLAVKFRHHPAVSPPPGLLPVWLKYRSQLPLGFVVWKTFENVELPEVAA